MHELKPRCDKGYLLFAAILTVLLGLKFIYTGQSFAQVTPSEGANLRAQDWDYAVTSDVNATLLTVIADGREYTNLNDGIYMDEQRRIMVPAQMIRDAFDCSAHLYDNRRLVIEKKDDILEFEVNKDYYIRNKEKQKQPHTIVEKDGRLCLPFEILAKELGYTYDWDIETNTLSVQSIPSADGRSLPYRYDLREKGRAPKVRDQGPYGTCWAFASLTALESSLLPEEELLLSVDHMNQNNSFTSSSKDGGQYTMAMAYLAAWQGPVYEADDPYGDGVTDRALTAVRHVQEMQIIDGKNLDGIKKAVFQYGGVESCIYTTLQSADGESASYNPKTNAYCYLGEEKPNHDVVIIGWDDHFARSNFRTPVADDGAFICQNSWGTAFGDDGVFYVSYYDTNIGMHSLVFTEIEESTNYDRIYQADLCGWVGQMGYKKESIYGANVYTAKSEEDVAAAGFYTTDRDTRYKVYLVPEFTDPDSLNNRILVAQGQFAYAGYHTVRFEQSIRIAAGRKFAVAVWLSTPNALRPMAIEYAADELTRQVALDDGEGYISAQGTKWADAKEKLNCNLCIKAYTRKVR
ncbi:MAG: cell surface protein [Eubacterium sp.]|jgi:C1A family cysteine protease|nr:cell surface protein [Eubacterium sp.]